MLASIDVSFRLQGLARSIIVFSGPSAGSKKDTVLAILSEVDWSQELQFEGVDSSVAPTLVEEALKYGAVNEHDPIGLYYMTKDEALTILSEK